MRALLPGARKRRTSLTRHSCSSRAKLAASSGANASGKNGAAEGGGLPASQRGSTGEVDANADDDPVAAALEQDSGQLSAAEQDVVGPLEHQRLGRNRDIHRFDEGKPGCQ